MSMISESKTLTALAALHMHAPSQRLSFELFLPHLDSISESEPLMMVVTTSGHDGHDGGSDGEVGWSQ